MGSKQLSSVIALLAMTLGPGSAHAKSALSQPPLTEWKIDFADDSCAMRRGFGTPDKLTVLELRRFGPGTATQFTVVTNALKITRAPFQYKFNSDEEFRQPAIWDYAGMGDGKVGVVFDGSVVQPPRDGEAAKDRYRQEASDEKSMSQLLASEARDAERAASATSMTLKKAFNHELTLETGPLDVPLKEIDACFDDLLRGWGLDVEAQHTLTRRAKPINIAAVAKMVDYPRKMLSKGLQGVVNLRLAVSQTGEVTGCFIQAPISNPAFDSNTCLNVAHDIAFEPALDRDGKPIGSYWLVRVNYRIN